MYASVADLRAEGVTTSEVDDARLALLIRECTALIDRACGWWFEPRTVGFVLSGRGSRFLELPVPPITLSSLSLDGTALSVESPNCRILGDSVTGPSCTIKHIVVFRRGRDNVEVSGSFGYVDHDASGAVIVPDSVRRACMMLVIDRVPRLGSSDASALRDRWRILKEETRDQSVTYAERQQSVSATGNPDVDQLLSIYRKPLQLGAA
jgi:hypothetical protein